MLHTSQSGLLEGILKVSFLSFLVELGDVRRKMQKYMNAT